MKIQTLFKRFPGITIYLLIFHLVFQTSALAAIRTVAVDGTGDYNCNGVDDNIQINQALAFIAADGGGTVHLKTGTYIISAPVEIAGNNTVLEGEGIEQTIIKLVDEANWGVIVGEGETANYLMAEPLVTNIEGALHDLTIRNLKIDGNKNNQHYTHPTRGDLSVPDGHGNYDGLRIIPVNTQERVSNIQITNVYVYENNSDAFIVFNGDHIQVERCKTLHIGHSAVYFLDPVHLLVQDNNFTIAANSGIRWYDGNHIIVRNNFLQGSPDKDGSSNFCIQVTSGQTSRVLDDLLIENNEMQYTAGAAIALDAKHPVQATGVVIRNNSIYQCGNVGTWVNQRETGGINIKNFTKTLIENNTIVNCIGSAIRLGGNVGFNDQWEEIKGLTAVIRNNIITNTIDEEGMPQEVDAYGIDVAPGNSAVCTYNNLWSNYSGNYRGCIPEIGSISVDPKYRRADLGTGFNNTNGIADFHLKSGFGSWNSAQSIWETDVETSICINAGDREISYMQEPAPNGNRINMGMYGNTAEASKGIQSPPVADAGPDQVIREDGRGYVFVDLDGSSSSDNGTITGYIWTHDGIILAEGATPSAVPMMIGIHKILLSVTDNDNTSTTDTVEIRVNRNGQNIPPTAVPGDDQTVTDNDSSGGERVLLDGRASWDSDGTVISYEWKDEQDNVLSTEANPTLDFTVGIHTVTLTVTDTESGTDSGTVHVEVRGENDYALQFNNTSIDEFVTIQNLPISSSLTIEMWIKQNTSSNDVDALLNFGGDGQRLVLKTDRNPSWGEGTTAYSDTEIPLHQWHHLAFVAENNILTALYVDGVSQNVLGGATVLMPEANFGIASFYGSDASVYNFQGSIDELRIWDVVRNEAQINASKDHELTGNEAHLTGYWNFNDGSGEKLADQSGGHDGILVNMDPEDWVLGAIHPIGSIQYRLTVDQGSSDGAYEAGATIDIVADAPQTGFSFSHWTSTNDGSFVDVSSEATIFIMPPNNTTLIAHYRDNGGQNDRDGDTIADSVDNCPDHSNANQDDFDGDNLGDVCDPDDDNDGMSDSWENTYGLNAKDPTDRNGDPDGDGRDNYQEYSMGTNPQVADTGIKSLFFPIKSNNGSMIIIHL